MFSIDDPETWCDAAQLDYELQEILRKDSKPRFFRDGQDYVRIRQEWESIARADADAALEAARDQVEETTILIPRSSQPDAKHIRALLYTPKTQPVDGSPLLVLFHGGAFCFGCPEFESIYCIEAVKNFGCVAISVDYTLSPDEKSPYVFHESWDVLKWTASHAEFLNATPSKGFIVGGTSAGALIACNLVHFAQDQGLKHPITGVLYSAGGFIDPAFTAPKYKAWNRTREELWSVSFHPVTDPFDVVGAIGGEDSSVLNNPLNWPSGHAGHPPAVFLVCGLDMLRDESLLMDRELRLEWGVKTKVYVYAGLPHIFWMNYPTHSRAAQYKVDVVEGLDWLLHGQNRVQ